MKVSRVAGCGDGASDGEMGRGRRLGKWRNLDTGEDDEEEEVR